MVILTGAGTRLPVRKGSGPARRGKKGGEGSKGVRGTTNPRFWPLKRLEQGPVKADQGTQAGVEAGSHGTAADTFRPVEGWGG